MLRELDELQTLIESGHGLVRARHLADVSAGGVRLPIIGLVIGPEDRRLPTLGIFGGVHGLERVGTQVALAYLFSLVEGLQWDAHSRKRFDTCRVVAIPLVNPGGMYMVRRSNPRGVDLMRNAPADAIDRPPPLLGGHRLSPLLPFYRGERGAPMEVESATLARFVEEEMFEASAAIALDMHSGFGAFDRIWYPYARSRHGFPRLVEAQNLIHLFDETFPHHRYTIEPQSASYSVEQTAQAYTIRGDLWDHLYDRRRAAGPGALLPLTLEMGSWAWVRKNPWQGISSLGRFNPVVPHRLRRVMRHHFLLVDFMVRAVHNPDVWRRKAVGTDGPGQPG